jgi:hypothetical protein
VYEWPGQPSGQPVNWQADQFAQIEPRSTETYALLMKCTLGQRFGIRV